MLALPHVVELPPAVQQPSVSLVVLAVAFAGRPLLRELPAHELLTAVHPLRSCSAGSYLGLAQRARDDQKARGLEHKALGCGHGARRPIR
jgi:hypothetical protein